MTYYDKETGEIVSDDDMLTRYREMLDDVIGEVAIGSLTYAASVALERVDPIAFRVGLSDYESSELDESIVEEGWWVRVLTEDGEIETEPEWFTDEEDAWDAFREHEDTYADSEDILTVQMYGTDDRMIAESRIEN